MNLEPVRFKEYSVLIIALIGGAMSMSERLSKKKLLIYTAVIPLAISLVYSLFYISSYLGLSLFVFTNRSPVDQSSLLSAPLDIAVWAIAVFMIIAWLGYTLELNLVRGYIRPYLGVGLLALISGLAVGVCLVALGFVGIVGLAPISLLLVGMCIEFSNDFFDVDMKPFCLKLLFGGLIIGLLFMFVGFLL